MIWWPLLVLALGCAMAAASSGRWQLGIAAWIAPATLLCFSRTQDLPVALVGVFVALLLAGLVAYRGVLPLTGAAYAASIVAQSAIGVVPFALDALVAPELPPFAAPFVFPAAWTAIEFAAARSSPLGTWGALAYSQHGNLPLVQLASVTGIWGITFVVAWVGSTASWVVIHGIPSAADAVGPAACLVGVTLVMLAGGARLLRSHREDHGLRVAAVEPTGELITPDALMAALTSAGGDADASAHARRTLQDLHDALLAASEREARAGARIVVWPEAGAPVLARDEAGLLDRARAFARVHGIHLVAGVVTIHPAERLRLENKAVLFGPSGEVLSSYRKARPVPGWEARVSLAGDGRIPVVSTTSGRLAEAICYDLDFPDLLRQAGRANADLLLVPASDWADIGRIHHAMASFRAVENGAALVRSARWGTSAVVDALGRTLALTDHRLPGADAAVAFVPIRHVRTTYARVGDAFAWACVLATCVVVFRGALLALAIA
jgi:apolipoprotein N-acyltransferase